MNIKTIVKVMNFHALLRVDRAHRDADQYQMLEREVARMIDIIQNNRNFILDKWTLTAKEDAPRLRIYIGSDLGFCGAANASVNSMLDEEIPENTVITIGKKVRKRELVDLSIQREEFEARYDEIEAILADGVRHRRYSGIDLCYDHYYNMTHIEPVKKTVFPIELERDELETYTEDFSVEGSDINTMMEDLIITYLNYEVKTAAVNAYASENILRQNATNESLKRVEEMEEEARWEERKSRNEKAARSVIDSYIKMKYRAR
ncbi:MAG: F0F1 ATP synthase subunit gamma [Oscillospiraceae bacterium]|nr:F0F1 ATP synthase subunit gamma [Oscillospiraceae bacterium]